MLGRTTGRMAELDEKYTLPSAKSIIINATVLLLILIALPALIILAISGDANWWQAWIVIALFTTTSITSRFLILKKHPDLAIERSRWSESRDTPKWDRVLMPIVSFIGLIAVWLVAAVDRLFGSLIRMPIPMTVIAFVTMLVGLSFSSWASIENKFFSAVVRIQKDRNHKTITTGPYSVVRHPGYAGGILAYIMIPIALGSLWSIIPCCLTILTMIMRTYKEDKFLEAKLTGYRKYMHRVRYRLIPYLW
jgi:protein-S-isoprenylcysteine O-methyltransferase Ste14